MDEAELRKTFDLKPAFVTIEKMVLEYRIASAAKYTDEQLDQMAGLRRAAFVKIAVDFMNQRTHGVEFDQELVDLRVREELIEELWKECGEGERRRPKSRGAGS